MNLAGIDTTEIVVPCMITEIPSFGTENEHCQSAYSNLGIEEINNKYLETRYFS